MKRISLVLVVLLVFSTAGALFANGSQEAKSIEVGVVYSKSGSGARIGQACINAAALAIEDINAAGGIKALGGAQLSMAVADTETDPQVAISQTERLINTRDIVAFNGSYYSGHTIPASEVAERNQIPWLTTSISDKITGRGYDYVFQVSPKASHFGFMQVETLKQLDEAYGVVNDKIAIVYENTAYGVDTATGVKEKAEALGYKIVLYEPYQANFSDADALVSKIKASGAQIVFPASYLTDAILILRTMKKLEVNAAFIGGGSGFLEPDFIKNMGADGEYVVSVSAWNYDLPYPSVQDFSKRYEAKYGEFMPEAAGESYVIMWIIKEAIEKAGSADPKLVRDALASLDLSGVAASGLPSDHVQFDENGWNKYVHPVMVQWQKGELRTIWPPDSAAVDAAWPVPAWSER